MILNTRAAVWLARCFLSLFFIPVILCARQEPIRVESNQVLVPTVVFDQVLYAKLNKMQPHHRDLYGHLVVKNAKLWEQITVKNLTEKDFHLFEDGQEQKIQSVRLEPPAFRVVEDNLGKHPETLGTGGGIWGYPDHPAEEQTMWLALPKYVIAYVPPASKLGSCHQIQVKVNEEKLTVWTRSEYCNTPHPATDPLSGTELGNKLEAAMHDGKENGIDLKLNVAAFAENAGLARVYASMEFPPESLVHQVRNGRLYATIGSLVMVYQKDGTLVARYSDFACCDYGNEKESGEDSKSANESETQGQSLMPSHYHTEFVLPPGEYEVRAVLSDGMHFGVETAALSIGKNEPGKLGISDVVLARRVRKMPPNNSAAEGQVSASYPPLVSKGVEYTPTANLRFWPGETLFVYFEIQEPLEERQPDKEVQANFRIVDAKLGAVVDAFEPVNVASYAEVDRAVAAMGRGVRLKELTPGEYRLEVRASEGTGKSTEWRSSVFTVMAAAPLESSATMPSKTSTASSFDTGTVNPTPQPTGADQPKKEEIVLNITALDMNDRAVADLTAADFRVFEDEKPQTIRSFKATPVPDARKAPHPPIVILFDLLNTIPFEREFIASRIIKVLEPLEADEGIYVYLLTNDGQLYFVGGPHKSFQAVAIAEGNIGGEGASGATIDDAAPWTKQIRPLLDQAINKVHGFRVMDYKDVAMLAVRTFNRLGWLGEEMAYVRGPKTVVWITSGVANSIGYHESACRDESFYGVTENYLAGTCSLECRPGPSDWKCMDYTPFLQHFSAEMTASNTTVSSVELTGVGALPDEVNGSGGDTLRQLAKLTGGRVYVGANNEVEKAIEETLQGVRGRYQLAYTAPPRDGKYHKVRVVCIREGVRIQAQQGYLSGRP